MSFLVLDILKQRFVMLIKSHKDFFLSTKLKPSRQSRISYHFFVFVVVGGVVVFCFFFSLGVYCSRVYSTRFTVHGISQCPVEKLVRTTLLKGYVIYPIFCQYLPFNNFKVTLCTKNAASPLLKQAIKRMEITKPSTCNAPYATLLLFA